MKENNDQVRVMSFNVLNGWMRHTRVHSTVVARGEKAAELILSLRPDILCPQEFDYYYRYDSAWIEQLSPYYSEVRPQNVAAGLIWNPIFYDREIWTEIACGYLDFTKHGFVMVLTKDANTAAYPQNATNGSIYTYPEGSEEALQGGGESKFRTLTWALLKHRNGKRLLVANTHYSLRTVCHALEVEFVEGQLKRLREEYGCPLILCGDYNSTVNNGACGAMLANGWLDTFDLAETKDDIATCHSTSGHGEGHPDLMPVGTYRERAIDHILTLDKLNVREFRICAKTEFLDASDHCPIICHFLL